MLAYDTVTTPSQVISKNMHSKQLHTYLFKLHTYQPVATFPKCAPPAIIRNDLTICCTSVGVHLNRYPSDMICLTFVMVRKICIIDGAQVLFSLFSHCDEECGGKNSKFILRRSCGKEIVNKRQHKLVLFLSRNKIFILFIRFSSRIILIFCFHLHNYLSLL